MSTSSSKQECKVFVGGLSWETNDQKLRMYFENYGNVTEAFVNYDRNTGRPRGFGFVVFDDPNVADRVVLQAHTIDRREVEAKKAVPKEEHQSTKKQGTEGGGSQHSKKIFVGGLAPTVDEKAFREYFEQYGLVKDAVVMYDHENKRPRGFGFVTFQDDEAVSKVFANGVMQTLHDKKIEIKHAVPRDQMAVTRTPAPLTQRAFVGPSPDYVYPQAPFGAIGGTPPGPYPAPGRHYSKFSSPVRMTHPLLSSGVGTGAPGGGMQLGLDSNGGRHPLGATGGGFAANMGSYGGTGLHTGYGMSNMLFSSNPGDPVLGSGVSGTGVYPHGPFGGDLSTDRTNPNSVMTHNLPMGGMSGTVKQFGSFSGHSAGSGYGGGGFSPGGHIDSVTSINATGGVVSEADLDHHTQGAGLPLSASVKTTDYHTPHVYDAAAFSEGPNPGWSN
eukprot:g5388.t1